MLGLVLCNTGHSSPRQICAFCLLQMSKGTTHEWMLAVVAPFVSMSGLTVKPYLQAAALFGTFALPCSCAVFGVRHVS